MKNLLTFFLLGIVMSASVFCQPPQAFKYQAVVRDAAGEIISNQAVNIRISIHDETPGGTIVYQETHVGTTNSFGLINLNIGLGTPSIGFFVAIDWAIDTKFMEVEIDNGGDYTSLGTSELLSVPYAMYSNRSSDSYWNLDNSNIFYSSGNVGIGTTTPQELLEINGNGGLCGFRVNYGGTYDGLYGDFRQSGSGGLQINSQTPSGSGGWADLSFMTNGTTKMFIESGGNVGIGTTVPDIRLTVKSPGNSDVLKIISDNDDDLIRLRQTGNNSGAIYLYDGNVTNTVLLYGGGISYFNSSNVGIGTTSPNAPLHVNDRIRIGEDPSYSTVYGELIHEGGGTGFKINANAGGGSWADLCFQTNGNTRMFIESSGNVGIGTTTPSSKLDVRGNVTIRSASSGSIVMELGTGLDYAEGFNISEQNAVEPGTILCIDPMNHGELKISEKAYDKTVAGIVAGANGLGSGVRLGIDDFDCDVALAGRVYCNADATTGKIEAGDLLTTSSTPGFAMKVNDYEKAHGAIIGKAMESLEKGKKGQILVLVTLQ